MSQGQRAMFKDKNREEVIKLPMDHNGVPSGV